jgi:hypothetical protein
MTPAVPMDPRLRACLVAVAGSGAALAVGALLTFGGSTALSVAVGGGLAAANLWALARIIGALLPSDGAAAAAQSRAGWSLVVGLKMIGLVLGAWLLMRHGWVAPLPLVVGFGALPIGIAIGSLVSDKVAPPGKD